MLLDRNKGISSIIAMLIAAGVVIVGISYWLLFTANMDGGGTEDIMQGEDAMMEDNSSMDESAMQDGFMDEGDAMMEEDHSDTMDQTDSTAPSTNNNSQPQNNHPEEASAVTPGVYIDYSAEALASAQSERKKPVLFFWAAWCPFCKTANEEFNSNLDKIPSNVVLLKTNYDTETLLKIKYGITYQHTFVQVDANGNQVTKWSGGGIDELLANVQ